MRERKRERERKKKTREKKRKSERERQKTRTKETERKKKEGDHFHNLSLLNYFFEEVFDFRLTSLSLSLSPTEQSAYPYDNSVE